MKKNIIRLIASTLCVAIMLGLVPTSIINYGLLGIQAHAAISMTTNEVTAKLTSFQSIYNGKYWNAGKSQSSLMTAINNGKTDNASLGLTSKRCLGTFVTKEANGAKCQTCTSNSYQGWQCQGFAHFLLYSLFRVNTNGESGGNGYTRIDGKNVTSLQPGDYIRCSGHSAVVWKIVDSNLYVAQCWGGSGPNYQKSGVDYGTSGCKIVWGGWNSSSAGTVSNMLSKLKTSGYVLRPTSYITTKPQTGPSEISISNQVFPSGKLPKGKSFGIYGDLISKYNITKVVTTVKNSSNNNAVSPIEEHPNSTTYSLRGRVNNEIIFNNFSEGSYTFKIEVWDNKDYKTNPKSFTSSFIIGNGNPIPTPRTPTFSPLEIIPGGYRLMINPSDYGTIYYTTDGSNPATNGIEYIDIVTSPYLYFYSNCTLKAIAINGNQQSGVATLNINVSKVDQPTITSTLTGNSVCVTLSCSTPGAKIYYTSDGRNPSIYSSRYNGPIYLGYSTTIKAYAVKDGCSDSAVSQKTVVVRPPDAPRIEIPTKADIAVGDPIEVRWNTQEHASYYKVRIYKDKNLIATKDVNGSKYAYIPDSSGSYTFGVDAVNFVGMSSSDSTKAVFAHDPVIVKFVDRDIKTNEETIIKEQKVDYGYSATVPPTPKKKGWVFCEWDSRNYLNVTSDVKITAVWDREKYVVRFVDEDGVALAPQQEVEFEGSVVLPPEPSNGLAGYKFMDWRVLSADNSSLLDYTCVDANLTLQAVFDWGNKDLPVAVQRATVTANDDGKHYTADYTLNNGWDETVYCRVVITLKTSTGKAVITDTRDVTIPPRGTYVPKENTEIICDKVATKAVINVVGLNDDLTGGAYASPYTLNITKTKYWSDWSTNPSNSDGSDGSVKTQYSYQTKTYTTSSSRPLAGWTEYGTPSYNDVWGNYGNWTTTRESTNELKQEQIGTQYRYYYYSCQNCGGRSPYYNITCPHCGKVKIGNNWHCTWSTTRYQDAAWYNWDNSKRYTYSLDGTAWFWSTGNTGATAVGTIDSTSNAVVIRQAYRYRTATRNYTYYYYRWGDWSGWSDSYISQTSDRNVTTRNMYRHLIADPVSNDGENNTGEEYTVTGNLSTLNDDYSGKSAIVFVYKSQINDPTANVIMYVGNIVIGEENSYDFSFVPSQSPDEARSNFTVALAIEGQTALMNIDVITSSASEYDVEFFAEGISISNQKVQEGKDAIIPTPIEIPGKVFVGWNNDTTNVLAPRKIEAYYVNETYSIVFVDFESDYVSMEQYQFGDVITIPEPGEVEGKTFLGWDGLDEDDPIAIGHAVYVAKYETGTFTVKFDDGYGNILSTQIVDYGNSAELPEAPEKEGLVFMGWRQDQSWWNVKCDMVVSPIWIYENSAIQPTVNVENYYFGGAISAETDIEGATIYCAIDDGRGTPPEKLPGQESDITNESSGEQDGLSNNKNLNSAMQKLSVSAFSLLSVNAYAEGGIEEDLEYSGQDYDPYNWFEYDDSLVLNEDAVIYFYVASEGMNDSEIVTLNYEYVPVQNPYEDHSGETFTVTFLDDDGFVLDEQTVNYFENAVAPEVEEREGYVFIGWDNRFDHVTQDIEIVAQYVPEDEYVSFTINSENITVTAGDTYSLNITVENAPEDMGVVTWKSSNDMVASVSIDGLVMASQAGETVITAKSGNGKYSANCKVTVLPNLNDTVTLRSNSNLSLENGMLTQIPIVLTGNRGVAATVGEIKEQLATPNVKIVDADGNELEDSKSVATNTQIRIIVDDIVVDAVIVIVTGDYDGNGSINNRDASRIMRYLVNKENPDEYQLYASDVNKDGDVNNRDAAMVSRYLVGKETL